MGKGKKMRKTITGVLFIYLFFTTTGAQGKELKISVEEYQDKVYASWLGQCIGNIYGLPHENQYIDKPGPETFPYGYSDDDERLKETNGVPCMLRLFLSRTLLK